ncbi:MAG TPA: phosphatidate cytidylyltransferase [Bacteroidota bacterium]|nr:phosphatidate cytidylyltransferase [Bacteroidota bacterium]
MSNLTQRIGTAAVAIPIIVLVCLLGGIWFLFFIAAASFVALREFYLIAGAKGAKPQVGTGLAAGLFVNLTFYHSRLSSATVGILHDLGWSGPFPTQTQLLAIGLIVIVMALAVVEIFRNDGSAVLNIASTVTGIMYVSLFFGTFIGLREVFVQGDFPAYRYFPVETAASSAAMWDEVYRWGGYTVISVLSMIWICDTAAYHTGAAIGRHKLFPRVSPNKTWEGAVAGFVFAILSALAARALVLDYLGVGDALVLGGIVGTFGQLGDLFESSLKRDAGVKDSSNLLPGHGGVLDRFDSLLFVAPLAYLYIDYIILS